MSFPETLQSRHAMLEGHIQGTLANGHARNALVDTILSAVVQARQNELAALVSKETRNVVSAGPFQGMVMPKTGEAAEGDRAPKLLGIYEQELHIYIEHFRQKHYDAVVALGFTDGYYPVGLSCIFPKTPVFFFSPDEHAQQACFATAELNSRTANVNVGRDCTAATIAGISGRYRSLLCLVRWERSALDLFPDSLVSSHLGPADIIVDCSDDKGTAVALRNRMKDSHFVVEVAACGRNPNTYPFLNQLSELDRWLSVWERKPGAARWAVFESKDARRLVNRA